MKQAFRAIERSRIFREVFNDEASTKKNGGVPTNVVWQDGKGIFGGVNSTIRLSLLRLQNNFTIRVKLTPSVIANKTIFSIGTGSSSQVVVDLDVNNKVRFFGYSGGITKGDLATNILIDENSTGELICTLDDNGLFRSYFNGEYRHEVDYATPIVLDNVNFLPTIGARYNTTYFKGSMDFFEIYNRALTAEEASLLYKGRYNRKPVLDNLLLDLDTTKGYLKLTTGDNRENMFTNSEVFYHWYKQGSPIVIESDVEPFVLGGYADKVTTAYPNYIRPNPLATYVIGNRYKVTWWIKNIDSTRIILWGRASVNSYYLNVDFSGSEISSLGLITGESATYEDLGNGWYRIDIIFQALEAVSYDRIYPSASSSVTSSIYIARAQLQRMEVDGEYVVTPGDDEKQSIILTPSNIDFKKIGTNYALEANGSTTKIDCGTDFIGTKAITVLVWLNAESLGATAGRILDNGQFIIWTTGTVYTFRASSDNGINQAVAVTDDINFGKMQLLIITRDVDGKVNFYLGDKDNPPVLRNTADQDSGTPVDGTSNVFIYNREAEDRALDGLNPKLTIMEGVLTLEERTNYWSETKKKIG